MSKKLELGNAAESIATMVIEWVDGGIKMGTDWRSGLASVIQLRLDRVDAISQLAALREELAAEKDRHSRDIDEADEETSALREVIRDLKSWREVSQSLAVFAKIISDAEAIVPRPGPLRIELTEIKESLAYRGSLLNRTQQRAEVAEQRLSDAERRNAELTGLLREVTPELDDFITGSLLERLKAAINPNPEAASHDE